jgi:hypothetical protein
MMVRVGRESDESVWSAPGESPPAPPPGSPTPGPPGPSAPPPLSPPLAAPSQPPRTVRGAALATCIVVGLLGLGSCAALVVGTVQLARGPIRATDRYFAALERGDFATAYALECPSMKLLADEVALRSRYTDDAVLSWHTHGFETSHAIGADTEATVSGTLTTAKEGARDVTIELTDSDGGWRLCRVDALG